MSEHEVGPSRVVERTLEEELREISQIHGVPEDELKGYYEEAFSVAQNVVRKALLGVLKYAEFRAEQLITGGLRTEIRSSIKTTKDSVVLSIEFVPTKDQVLDVVKNRAFKRMIKWYEKEQRKRQKEMRLVESEARAGYTG